MGNPDLSDLWLEGYDGLAPSDMDGALPRPAKGYVTVPLAWLARVRREARSVDQLLVMLVLYRQCLMRISRQTKYRALAELEEAGALIKEPWNGRSVQVTLHWFP